jgi:hypothetical protein
VAELADRLIHLRARPAGCPDGWNAGVVEGHAEFVKSSLDFSTKWQECIDCAE